MTRKKLKKAKEPKPARGKPAEVSPTPEPVVPPEAEAALIQALVPTHQDAEDAVVEEWWDDGGPEQRKRKERALEMVLAGVPKTQIARDLGLHRNTVNLWCQRDEFQMALQERMADHVSAVRQRRIRQSNLFADRVFKAADKAMEVAEKAPQDPVATRQALTWMQEFRAWRGEERVDFGDNVQRHDHRMMGAIGVGVVGGGTSAEKKREKVRGSFSKFLTEKLESIDPAQLNTTSVETVMTSLVEQALIGDEEILEQIHEEDLERSATEEGQS